MVDCGPYSLVVSPVWYFKVFLMVLELVLRLFASDLWLTLGFVWLLMRDIVFVVV